MKKYQTKMKNMLAVLQDKANKKGIYENYGQKEYRAFKDKVNNDKALSYAEKSQLCADFSYEVSHMNPIN